MKVILVVVAAGFSLVAHAGEFNLEKTYGITLDELQANQNHFKSIKNLCELVEDNLKND